MNTIPFYFLSIFATAVFSVLFGIVLKVTIAEYGFVLAFALWGVSFLCDLASTLMTPNYTIYETNRLFAFLSGYMQKKSFIVIAALSVSIQVVAFLLFSDLIVTYILTVAGFCACFSNMYHRKKLLKCK
jgi:hypothetical protein